MAERKQVRIALDTLGCKVNQAETEQLARRFTAAGYQVVPPATAADIYILNTCTVTHIADRKARHWLRLSHRRNPKALLVATGCYAERAAGEISKIEGVSLVIGNDEKERIVEILDWLTIKNTDTLRQAQVERYDNEPPELSANLRTRTFIKVQDGCRNFCSYCIVPLVRSREHSTPVEQVITQIKEQQMAGYQEVVITGVEVGSYDDNGVNLTELLQRILAATNIPRLRLSSLQPVEVTKELLRLWQDSRLCRHFHLSLQSGSDSVLKRMNRRYSSADYAYSVALIRSSIPDVAITTDIIVGFPGETDVEFEESRRFCKQMDFTRIHVFPFSPRSGTKAAGLPDRVNDKVKKQRTAQMLSLAGECIQNFSRKFIGRTMLVLFEQKESGLWLGLTDNYIRVYVESGEDLTNKIRKVNLREVWGEGVRGSISR